MAMPAAAQRAGTIPACGIMICVGVPTALSSGILLSGCARTRTSSYGQTVARCLGRRVPEAYTGAALDAAASLYLLGAQAAFLLFAADFAQSLCDAAASLLVGASEAALPPRDSRALIVIAAVLTTCASLRGELRAVQKFAKLGMGASLLTALCVMCSGRPRGGALFERSHDEETQVTEMPGVSLFSFGVAFNVAQLPRRCRARRRRAAGSAQWRALASWPFSTAALQRVSSTPLAAQKLSPTASWTHTRATAPSSWVAAWRCCARCSRAPL